MTVAAPRDALHTIAQAVTAAWPEHAGFIGKSLSGRSDAVLDVSERLSDAILKLAPSIEGGIPTLVADYRFLCEEIVLPEEMYFRRNDRYRLSSFEDANRECYANAPFMDRYMNGLLLSDVLWSNHAHAFAYFVDQYLTHLPEGARHLEIGPGHGLLLYFAAASGRLSKIAGWDVSPTSIAKTQHALDLLGVTAPVDLTLQDLFAAPAPGEDALFDGIVMSEILEHLEQPVAALQSAALWLAPGGHLWINVPANSPAPDHIFLFDGLDHAQAIAREAGLEVIDAVAFPMSGTTLARAEKHKLSISCSVLARRPR
jgi:2-polyprenyl-3-methyl-5-hydroxy-6-metoxy-1,4-benzoquinol methylase